MRKHQRTADATNSYSILALDDDATMTLTLQTYFRRSGYQVDAENDPNRAIERIREGNYDILLLDFLMTPICGDQVVEQIRAFNQDLYIILLTGHKSMAPPIKTIRDLDIQGYYEKSERFDQLELLVESCIKSIKQVRTIRNYQQGLSDIMELLPKVYPLQRQEEILDAILYAAAQMLEAKSGYIALYKGEEAGKENTGANIKYVIRTLGDPDGWKEVEALLSQGDQLPDRIAALQERGKMVSLIVDDDKTYLGLLGIQVESQPEYYQKQLLGVFVRQAAAILHNASLHNLLNRKNEELVEANRSITNSFMEVISALRLLVDARDIYTRGHSDRVSYFAKRIAHALGGNEGFCQRIGLAGLFHDIGKIGVPDTILFKNGPLTPEEREKMQEHPMIGVRILSTMTKAQDVIPLVRWHHERMDGKGYPDGMKGEEIPLGARIIAAADSLDAMTSNRRYRDSIGMERAIGELKAGRGTQFDPRVVDVLLEILADPQTLEADLAKIDG